MIQGPIEAAVCAKPWPCREALHVMWCESGGRPDAINMWTATAIPDDGVFGLFQIANYANGKLQWIGWDLFDPLQNIEAAFILWTGNGGAWAPDFACRP